MNYRKKVLFCGCILITLILLSFIYFLMPKVDIKINGNKTITLQVGETYEEKGAVAYVNSFFKKQSIEVEIDSNIDPEVIGSYSVNYIVTYYGKKFQETRKIKIIDNINPTITLNDKVKMCESNNRLIINVNAYDNYDGDITNKVAYKVKDKKIYINVEDSSNNKTELVETVIFIDAEKPSIALKGNSEINLSIGDKYEEYGATAYDSCDGDISDQITITGNVDTTKMGKYEKVYSIKDTFGNERTIKRIINVNDSHKIPGNGHIVYLTFDDGPGQYTEELLKILGKYNVKATFFVTNQFPKYQNMIKLEYENGHAVGIHTYSHKWNIYSSVDSYLDDFNKIEKVIYEQTGVHPNIFRFPGGSSNTVSKNYNKGIMTKLSQIMTEKGYTYYDWSFDSGDTSKNNSKENIIKNVKYNLSKPGDYVILMHDIKKNTIDALPTIIEYAISNGYTFDILNEKAPIEHFKIAN